MTREEQIRQAALKECKSFDIPDKQVRFKGVNSAYGLGFCEGAIWADKTMIEKACKWIENNKHLHKEMFFGSLSTNWVKFIREFRKAMEL